jgi:hypothetical protein
VHADDDDACLAAWKPRSPSFRKRECQLATRCVAPGKIAGIAWIDRRPVGDGLVDRVTHTGVMSWVRV